MYLRPRYFPPREIIFSFSNDCAILLGPRSIVQIASLSRARQVGLSTGRFTALMNNTHGRDFRVISDIYQGRGRDPNLDPINKSANETKRQF